MLELQANPPANVTFHVMSEQGRNGHNTYFYSPEAQSYLAECAERLADLQDEHGDDIPEEVQAEFLASIDKRRANVADPVLIDEIDAFLSAAVG